MIGIRPLEGCHEDFGKILKTERLYLFDNKYHLEYNDNNEIIRIKLKSENDNTPINFYSDNLSIRINAIVGGNGSGKSSLAELFLYFMFYYGLQKEQISKYQYTTDSDDEGFGAFQQVRYTQELRKMQLYLNVELLYFYNDELYHVNLNRNNFKIKVYQQTFNHYSLSKEIPFKDFIFPFYSMYVNYSHYGLNTNISGAWLRTLFHKNDGYQLPVVINPFRIKGNIDINVENYLSRDRVFTNVIETADESLILPNHSIDYIEIARDSSKNVYKNPSYEQRLSDINTLIKPLYKIFFTDKDYPSTLNEYQTEVEDYLLRKIKTITEKYLEYKPYNRLLQLISTNAPFENDELKSLIKHLFQDRSHVTLKIRQSLNFLRHDLYQIDYTSGKSHFKLNEVVKIINEIKKDQFFTETIDYLPPPIFMTRFHFKDRSNFDKLSSGEKQQIYAIHSIIYHLKNIDSVHRSVDDKFKYNSVFLILDEIELYYHPQAQKKTIDRLLYVLEKSNLNNVKNLNISFLTHSPFILSDIPSEFVLKLKGGEIFTTQSAQKTFAANITDLLTDSFFLENGLIGDFAKDKIQKTIDWLNSFIAGNKVNPEISEDIINQHEALIKIIDEPLLSYKLTEMFQTVFPNRIDKVDAEKQIRDLAQKAGLNLKDLI